MGAEEKGECNRERGVGGQDGLVARRVVVCRRRVVDRLSEPLECGGRRVRAQQSDLHAERETGRRTRADTQRRKQRERLPRLVARQQRSSDEERRYLPARVVAYINLHCVHRRALPSVPRFCPVQRDTSCQRVLDEGRQRSRADQAPRLTRQDSGKCARHFPARARIARRSGSPRRETRPNDALTRALCQPY